MDSQISSTLTITRPVNLYPSSLHPDDAVTSHDQVVRPSFPSTGPPGLLHANWTPRLPTTSPRDKFIVLRFQSVSSPPTYDPYCTAGSQSKLIRRPLSSDFFPPRVQGPYRIVQVPLSYTFRHLRALLSFLFDNHSVIDASYSKPTRARSRWTFDLQDSVVMHPDDHRPGEIAYGFTRAKLSSHPIPRDHSPSRGEGDTTTTISEMRQKWDYEQSIPLEHIWAHGSDPSRAIIYKSDNGTIHITANDLQSPSSTAMNGSAPYVFRACGSIHWDSEHLSTIFEELASIPITPSAPSKLANSSASQDDPEVQLCCRIGDKLYHLPDFSSDEDNDDYDPDSLSDSNTDYLDVEGPYEIDTTCWNRPQAFERFLYRFFVPLGHYTPHSPSAVQSARRGRTEHRSDTSSPGPFNSPMKPSATQGTKLPSGA